MAQRAADSLGLDEKASMKHANMQARLMHNTYMEMGPYAAEIGPCWIWIGKRSNAGYGQINVRVDGKHKTLSAHRVSFEAFKGRKIREGYETMHKCDNRTCIAPNHLKEGKKKANMLDMHAKGRGHGGVLKERAPHKLHGKGE
jgi:HNH endonuclease